MGVFKHYDFGACNPYTGNFGTQPIYTVFPKMGAPGAAAEGPSEVLIGDALNLERGSHRPCEEVKSPKTSQEFPNFNLHFGDEGVAAISREDGYGPKGSQRFHSKSVFSGSDCRRSSTLFGCIGRKMSTSSVARIFPGGHLANLKLAGPKVLEYKRVQKGTKSYTARKEVSQ